MAFAESALKRIATLFSFLRSTNCGPIFFSSAATRSEEHTSELQSRLHLVCRLLLEKKKYIAHTLGLSARGGSAAGFVASVLGGPPVACHLVAAGPRPAVSDSIALAVLAPAS